MRTRQRRSLQYRIESLEGRAVPSTLGHGAPGAADIGTLQQVDSGVTITSATVDQRTGVVTITGTVTCPEPLLPPPGFPEQPPPPDTYLVPVYVQVTQPIGRTRSIQGFATIYVECSTTDAGEAVPFTATVTASNGKFGKGLAYVSVSTYSTFPPSQQTSVVRLASAR